MKTLGFLLCLLLTTAALGQAIGSAAAFNSQPQPVQIPSHPERASQKPMAPEQTVLVRSGYAYGQGERPLWEVVSKSVSTPLGDVARALRQEHATAKKARKVFEN